MPGQIADFVTGTKPVTDTDWMVTNNDKVLELSVTNSAVTRES